MAIPKKRPGDVIKADEFNELAGRTPPEISAPAAIRDGDTVTIRTAKSSSYDFEVVAEEDLAPFSVFGISGATPETNLPRPRPTVRAINDGGGSPLVLLTNGQTEIRSGDKGPAYVIGKEPVLLRIAADETGTGTTAGAGDGETAVRWADDGPLLALSKSFDGPSGIGLVAWFVGARGASGGGWLLKTTEEINARSGSIMGQGSAIVCKRNGSAIVETDEIITAYNAQLGESIPPGAYRQAKRWQGVALIDVVDCLEWEYL